MDLADFRTLLKTELISSLQVHLYTGQEMTFYNTLLLETAKLLPSPLAPTFVLHTHPLTALAPTPFCILNQTRLKNKEELFKLLITLVELSEGEAGAERGMLHLRRNGITLQTVLHYCEQLSQVAVALTEADLNPYWALLNPVLKFRTSRRLQRQRNRLLTASQFFSRGEFNPDYFLHRLSLLGDYLQQLKAEPLPLLSRQFIRICQLALLQQAEVSSPKLFQVLVQAPFLSELHSHRSGQVEEAGLGRGERRAGGAYGQFGLPGQQLVVEGEKEQYLTMSEKAIRAAMVPVSLTGILLILGVALRSS